MLGRAGHLYGRRVAPHDIAAAVGSGQSLIETATQGGIQFEKAKQPTSRTGSTQRDAIPRMWFDAARFEAELEALARYRRA